MAAMTDYLERIILDHILNNGLDIGELPSYANGVYLSLHTTDSTDSTPGTEVTGGNYSRVQLDHAFNTMTAVTDGTTENTAEISFPQASASWGTVVSIGLYDASTAGNMLFYGELTVDKAVDTNDTFKIAAGDLSIQIDN